VTYNPWVPLQQQDADYDCSQESDEYMLRGWGRTPSDAWMTRSWIDEGVMTPQYGLMDASGAGMAAWNNEYYGMDGLFSENFPSVTFNDLIDKVGSADQGVCAGGRNFYHWVGIRAYDPPTDALVLHNSANGYMGVYQTLSRSQFGALGPWSAVTLRWDHAAPPQTTWQTGIDVSSHQPDVDWDQVAAAGHRFAIVKATESIDYLNPEFARDWAEIPRVGMKRGAYHFARPDLTDGADAEASYFCQQVLAQGPLVAGDLLVLDLERGNGDLSAWSRAFADRVQLLTGLLPMIYTGGPFATEHGLANDLSLGSLGLWIANYREPPPPSAPAPWSTIQIWQDSATASVPGVGGDCDHNNALVDIETIVAEFGYEGSGPVTDTAPSYESLQTLCGVAYNADGSVRLGLEGAKAQTDVESMRQEIQNVINFLAANNPNPGG
jgi:lysozyme